MRFKRYLPWISAGLLLLCLSVAWLSSDHFCYGSLLMGVTVLGGLTTIGFWVPFWRKLEPPENPVVQHSREKYISPRKQKLFPDLVPIWRRGMEIPIPSEADVKIMAEETEQWGIIGEFDLIRRLNPIVPADTLILHSVMPKYGDDMDVVVIGSKGFWYFEVKHWNASFAWRDGIWDIRQFDRDLGRIARVERDEYPDAQWSRMRDEALYSLNSNGRDLLAKAPILAKVKGGIVFSNQNAKFNIQKPAPLSWGTIGYWIKVYQAAPRLEEMTPEVVLQLTEILLKRHQDLTLDATVYSMDAHVAKVLKKAERGIQDWIDAS
jgi:hypothetical protein